MAYVIASVASADIFCRKLGFDGLGAKAVRQAWTCKRRHRIPSPVCQAATHREANDADIDLSNGALSMCRVVLVSPQRPGNVGAVARLCANHECRNLWVVNPSCDVLAEEAFMFAATSVGWQLLRGVRVVPSLAEALCDCNAAVGFSRRVGQRRLPSLHVRQLAELARTPEQEGGGERAGRGGGRGEGQEEGRGEEGGERASLLGAAERQTLALVFGREDIGLLTEELAMCSHVCELATGRWQPSLNLSQACAVALSRLYEGVASPPPPPPPPPLRQLSTTHDSISTANGARATLPEDADEVGRPTNAPALPGSMAPHPRSAAYRSLPGSATLAEVDAVIRRWDQLVSASADLIQWAGNDASSAAGTATPGRPSTPSSGSPPAGNPSGTTPAASRAQAGPGRLGPVADASGVDTVGGDVPPEEFEGRGYQRAAGTVDAAVGSRNDMGATSHRAGSESGGVKTGGGKDPARQGGARIAGGNAGDDTFSDRFVPQMRRLLLRANASKRELQFLHGFFSLVQQALAAQQVPR
eukprot:jgi/Mesvir1/25122/Mv21581-RA.1